MAHMDDGEAPARRKNLVARRTERVRREVAAAAEDLFAKRGYDDTTVEDIAEAAEISPRTFYRLYPAKADVVVDMARTRFGDFVAALADRPADEPLLESIDAVLVAGFADVDPGQLRSFEELLARNPELGARLHERGSLQQSQLAEVVAKRLGVAPDDLRANVIAATIVATIRTAHEVWSRRPGRGGPVPTLRKALAIVAPMLDS
jgi:AcrR family transcriptional regulator